MSNRRFEMHQYRQIIARMEMSFRHEKKGMKSPQKVRGKNKDV
jgi:hypothetical protein